VFSKVLIANRGEIAVRLVRALRDLGIASVAVHARDDASALHVQLADAAVALDATGPSAYLDVAALIAVAKAQGCDAVHPGYGFLSERADFAEACADAGLVFIGPTPEQLSLFGDKARARELATQCDVPVMPGSAGAVTLAEAQAFFAEQHAQGAGVMVKAIGGGGGRGMRAVLNAEDLPEAHARCMSEAKAAFGIEGVYVERLMRNARHIEVQVLGDGQAVASLGERECTLQRRFQKLVEIAPSPSLPEALRAQVTQAALRMAKTVGYRGLGTFEFLVDAASATLPFVFIEANPRLQVEHTVTEAVTGLDLVQLQIAVAAGESLERALGIAGRPHRAAARLRGAVAHQRRDARCAGQRAAFGRHARALRPAERARRAHRYARLCGPRAVAALRHAARQADRAFAVAEFCRCAAPLAARAGRVPHRRHRDQSLAAARHRRAARVRDAGGAYALRRGASG
jgi:acetyl/propionyl-CoA carboxylase alpha subunit